MGYEKRPCADARACGGSFTARVSAANDNDVVSAMCQNLASEWGGLHSETSRTGRLIRSELFHVKRAAGPRPTSQCRIERIAGRAHLPCPPVL
jgi:hypothetical protein